MSCDYENFRDFNRCSYFQYEKYLGNLKRLVTTGNNHVLQIVFIK